MNLSVFTRFCFYMESHMGSPIWMKKGKYAVWPYIWYIFRLTSRTKHVRQLLEHVIKLLKVERYPQIVASSQYMLADIYVPAATNPACPNFKGNSFNISIKLFVFINLLSTLQIFKIHTTFKHSGDSLAKTVQGLLMEIYKSFTYNK